MTHHSVLITVVFTIYHLPFTRHGTPLPAYRLGNILLSRRFIRRRADRSAVCRDRSIADSSRRATPREIEAFGTPTIVHFSGVLLVAALVSAPWQGLSRVAILLGLCGVAGVTYTLVVYTRARRQTTYRVVFEDWLFHVGLPFIAYAFLLGSGVLLPRFAERALFLTGASCLLLLVMKGRQIQHCKPALWVDEYGTGGGSAGFEQPYTQVG